MQSDCRWRLVALPCKVDARPVIAASLLQAKMGALFFFRMRLGIADAACRKRPVTKKKTENIGLVCAAPT